VHAYRREATERSKIVFTDAHVAEAVASWQGDLLNDAQRHHRVDLERCVVGEMTSPVQFLIFKRMTNIEVRLADNGDDGRL